MMLVEKINGFTFYGIRRFKREDIMSINDWYMKQGSAGVTLRVLPWVGYIAPGVAAGFLYQTDSGICFLDGFVSNPDASGTDRNEAIENIREALEESARFHGFQKVYAFTKVDSFKKRLDRARYSALGDYSFHLKEIE